jgi:hypothetical protein
MVMLVAGYSALARDIKPGVERWPIKTSLPAEADPNNPQAVPLEDLLDLEEPPEVTKNDKRYQDALIPEFPNSLNVKEGDIISTVGWLHLVALEDDGDYHIQVSDSPTDGNNCLIVEIPQDDEKFVASAELRKLAGTARQLMRERLLKKPKEPSEAGNVMNTPPYMKITGQLFYDDAHVGDQPRGKQNPKTHEKMKAKTLWEIHPVTGIEFAPPPDG